VRRQTAPRPAIVESVTEVALLYDFRATNDRNPLNTHLLGGT
jgi:hypothetical protein